MNRKSLNILGCKAIFYLFIVFAAVALAITVNPCLQSVQAYSNPSKSEIKQKLYNAAVARNIPPEILYGIAYQESTWRQFNSSGNPLISPDGGIGIMQITSYGSFNIDQLKYNIDYNINAGADILTGKWYATPIIGDNSMNCYENWFYAVWAYNGWVAYSQYPYTVWSHIAGGRNGWWTGIPLTPVPKEWLVNGYGVRMPTPQPAHYFSPVTTLSTGSDSANSTGWYRRAPTITLTRNVSGTTYFRWGLGSWQTYSSPFKSKRKINILYYYSINTDNVKEAAKSKRFMVDDYKPRTYAPKRIIIRRGGVARLYWKVHDPYTADKAYVTLRLQKRVRLTRSVLQRKAVYLRRYKHYRERYAGTRQRKYNIAMHRYLNAYRNVDYRTVKNIRYGLMRVNRTRYYSQRINTAGAYRLLIYAKDRARNNQRNIARNYVYVR